MPLHGKIVVIKRSGGDGTEFPLTATCLFGRKPDCDIRIQLPQVSKEHCRIDLNENKEVILTNLSSVNPTQVNGEALQQSERLKHGDVITIIDRSFRFEYPPAPTPKKRSSTGGKAETLKVLQDQQVVDAAETGEKRISEVFTDGSNHDNIQRSLEKTLEVESKEDGSMLQNKTTSPFSDLYQMIKKSLDVKTPRKSSASVLQTPTSRFCTPKPVSVMKNGGKPAISTEDKSSPKKDEAQVFPGADETKVEAESDGTPKSVRKQRKSLQVPSDTAGPAADGAERAAESETASPPKRIRTPPQRFTAGDVVKQASARKPKSPVKRRSRETTPTAPDAEHLQTASPRKPGKAETGKETSKKRKSGELAADLPKPKMKKKRVSFGGYLSPELFDKRLPPDSPLRKGATPRRSLCLSQSTQSLLRRASVIGFLKEFEKDVRSPTKKKTPSPKKSPIAKNASPKTPTPAKKSPKSPKAASPGKKSPTSRSPSPKAASPGKKSPKSRSPSPKAASPGKKSPESKTPPAARGRSPSKKTESPKSTEQPKSRRKSATPAHVAETPSGRKSSSLVASGPLPQENALAVGVTPAKTPLNSGIATPTVQGRFSVSRISTPSPVAEDTAPGRMPSVTATPKIPLRRKSMKSTSRRPSMAKSAVKVIRRSGISRASMKVKNSWADIVKFGQTKAQGAAPAKTAVPKKTTKKAVSKPQTPARKLKGHASTGHADSPVDIVVGRAHKREVVRPTGAAPRLVINAALFKTNMKMDEDLTGVSEMFKTPVNERRRRSVDNGVAGTPVGALAASVVEPSVLNTPEEPGEMMVSPLSVASAVKGSSYSSEAVQRLLNGDEESSFLGEIPAMEIHSDESSEERPADVEPAPVTTPKQKPEEPECLTGVKRIMKTPKQKAEPMEDLRGKLLKTPKQKPEEPECLTGVKRIMKTPKQKVDPIEDLRGKLLKTPAQKPKQQECLTGVKRIMKTPKQKAEPVEDLRGKLLKTPKQKLEQQECLTGVKKIFETPRQEAEPLEDLPGKPRKTPKAPEADNASPDGAGELQEMLAIERESGDPSEATDVKTPSTKSSPLEKSAPVEDMAGVKRLMKTPREKAEAVEDNFGIKTLMKSPRLSASVPVEDCEGLGQVMEEPLADPSGQAETQEVEDQTPPECGEDIAKELDFALEELRDDAPSTAADGVLQVDPTNEADANEAVVDSHVEEPPQGLDDNESADAVEAIAQAAEDQSLPVEQPCAGAVDEDASEEPAQAETAPGKGVEMDPTAADPVPVKKSVRGRRAKKEESKAAEEQQEAAEDPVAVAPARGRRGRKAEAQAPSTVRQTTRSRNVKTSENEDVAPAVEESAPLPSKVALKPKRGRSAKKAPDDLAETVQEVPAETEVAPEAESEQVAAVDVDPRANDIVASQEMAVSKPKRGRKPKQVSQLVPEQQGAPQADTAKDANDICSDQTEAVPSGNEEHKSSDATETVPQVPVAQSLPEVDTETAPALKKSVRGRRAKAAGSKATEEKSDPTDHSEDPVAPAPVRGRRGRKTEAAAPPAVRQTTRSRNAKSQEGTSDDTPEMAPEKSVEAQPVPEISTEAESEQIPQINPSPYEEDSTSAAEEAIAKPTRGRRTKQTPVEPPQPEKDEVVSDAQQPTAGKPRRGRKPKPASAEQNEVVEETVVTEETKQQQQPQPPVRAKRGRHAKQEEEKREEDTKATSESQEPVKKSRRPRKAEHDLAETREEIVESIETVAPEEAEASPVAEPLKTSEQAPVAAKPKRGGRKAKQDAESETPAESTEVQEVLAVSCADKPKRGRRPKQVAEEVGVAAEVPEGKSDHELEAEEKKNAEPDAPVVKPTRARGVKSSAKKEVSQAIPAKRARRGAAPPPEETSTESTVLLVSEPALTSAEPFKRGRRAAAKPAADESTAGSDQTGPSEDSSSAPVQDTKTSKRSVKWKAALEIFEIPEATPVKAVRARRSKPGDHVEAEENDLSDEAVAAQPPKRARRGAKVADEEESSSKAADTETQPKPRRGRSAKN